MAQVDWDRRVKWAAAAASLGGDDVIDESLDRRPRIKDHNSGLHFLIDSGAAISIFPKAKCPNAKKDKSGGLSAVNGSKLDTFGTKTVHLRFDRKIYSHTMTIADVSTPIIGWDMITKYQFDILWSNNKSCLYSAN